MRLTAILLLSGCLSVSAAGFSQIIRLDLKNASLEQVFTQIKKQSGYSFVYYKEDIKTGEKITIKITSSNIDEVLQQVLKDQQLSYKIVDKTIVIAEKDPAHLTTGNFTVLPPPVDVHGRIVTENGDPISANVVVKGSNQGTSSNSEGYFTLRGIAQNAVLILSGVNIEAREIAIDGQSELYIIVKTKVVMQGEVIIDAGYYTVTDRERTSSISRIDAQTISKQPVGNVLSAMSGRMTGVYIQQNSGVPGGSFNVQIRGQNSLRNSFNDNGNRPLYLVDGTPFTSAPFASSNSAIVDGGNPLNCINVDEIESVEVLKDADATAIYGSRGANGVVLITTKKGKAEKSKLDVDFYQGIGRVSKTMDLLNTQQYLSMRNEAFANDAVNPGTYFQDYDILKWDKNRYTDWQKLLIGGQSEISNVQFSFAGGSDRTKILIGSTYRRESAVYADNFDDKKISANINMAHTTVNGKFKMDFSAYFLSDVNTLPRIDLTRMALTLPPNAPAVYNPDHSLNWENGTWNNPLAILQQNFNARTTNLISSTQLSYKIAKSLELRANAGYTQLNYDEYTSQPKSAFNPANNPKSSSTFVSNNGATWIVEPQLEYKKAFGKLSVSALAGATFQSGNQSGTNISATGFSSDALLRNMQAASSLSVSSVTITKYRYEAGFARINFNWQQKYFVNLTGRRDGSSRFGGNNQFGNFGAVGAAWIFSNENFCQHNLSFLSFGKLRGSYGITGSDQIGDYGFYDLWRTTSYSYGGINGLYANNLLNDNYGWEKNRKLELALELSFLKNRLNFSTSYYRNESGNQLVGIPLPFTTGFYSIMANLPAKVLNSGLEFEINSSVMKIKNFSWLVAANLTIPKNKLISYPGIQNSSYALTYIVGQPLSVKPSYHYLGVNGQTGVYTFDDVNRDGSLSTADYEGFKKIAQSYYGGISNSVYYKSLELDFFFQFVKQTGWTYVTYFTSLPGTASNQPAEVLKRWQKPGDLTKIQMFSQGFGSAYRNFSTMQSSDGRIGDASFIRLKNLSLSYRFPEKLLGKKHLQTIRFYVQGQNIFTFTNYIGLDPETQSASLPPLRTIVMGIHVTL